MMPKLIDADKLKAYLQKNSVMWCGAKMAEVEE